MNAIVLHSVVPVRQTASECSEQVTQLLFAQTVTVIERQPRWTRIRLEEDGQEGWVDEKMIVPMTDEESKQVSSYANNAIVKMPMAYAVSENNGQTIPLTAGTRLPDYQDGHFSILGVSFKIDPTMVAEQPIAMNATNLMQIVRFFLNIPYLWGGKNAMGMDCSGFTQVIHAIFGHSLLRNASEQAQQGKLISQLSRAQAGDLAFFDHGDGHISHVGILLDNERIIHCSGRVKVEKMDPKGIFSNEPNVGYTHHLVSIRRI